MKAYVHGVRLAPKKANLIAKLVRGLPVPVAVEALRRTNKKGARMIELLLRSAIANASHNDKQDPQMMIVKTIVVNQGTAYRRGMPKARGQTRPYRKFLSHIEVTLGFPEQREETSERKEKKERKAAKPGKEPSTTAKNEVKTLSSEKKSNKTSSSTSSTSPSSPSA